MNHRLIAAVKRLEAINESRAAAKAVANAESLPDPFWEEFSTKPGDPGFGRIAKAILKAHCQEKDRIEGRSGGPPSGLDTREVCRKAGLAMDAIIRGESPDTQ